MFEITLTGLTPRQCVLADIIWGMEHQDQVQKFIDTLGPQDRRDAIGLVQLMLIESCDQEATDHSIREAQRVIDSIRKIK